eukprot:sb/3462330/
MTTTPLPSVPLQEGDTLSTMSMLAPGDSGTQVDISVASEAVQAELTCPACNKAYEIPTEENARDKRPRVLPCLHTVCGECLEMLAKEDVKKKSIRCSRCPEKTLCCPGCNKGVGYTPKNPEVLRCPVCRREALIPGGTILGFKTNLRIMKLLQMVKMRGEHKLGLLTCVGCDLLSKYHCIECQENYCQRHADFHERSRATCDHHLVLIEDVLESHQAFQMLHKRHYCLTHPKELVSLFCNDCEKAVCPRCAIGHHKSHDVVSIEEVYEHIKVMTTTPLPSVPLQEGDTLSTMSMLAPGDSGTQVDISVASEAVQAELTCPACNKAYEIPTEENARDKRPRVLPCLHTVCGECLEMLAKEDVKKKSIRCSRCPEKTLCCPGCNKGVGYTPKNPEVLRCPVCRREALIPGGTILGFKTNLRIMKLLQMVKMRGEHKLGLLTCVGCDLLSKYHCIECQENYCQRHADFHERSRATCDHHLVLIEDVLESHQAFQMLHKRHYCLTHPKELVSLFCNDCEKAVCPRCAIGHHKSHDVVSIEEVYEHIKVKMEELKKRTETKIYNLKQSIVKIKNADRESDVESLAAKRKIQEMTERCINYLKEREEFINSVFSNWTEAEIVAIEDQMIDKLEELSAIETHKYTYPVSRTEFCKQSIVKIKNADRESDVESLAAKRKIQEMTERCINYLKEREVRNSCENCVGNDQKMTEDMYISDGACEAVDQGTKDVTEVIKELGAVISEERVRQAISTLGQVSRENTVDAGHRLMSR